MTNPTSLRVPFALVALLSCGPAWAQDGPDRIAVTVHDEVLTTIGQNFSGLHYDGPTHRAWDEVKRQTSPMPGAFGSPHCRRQLQAAGVGVARIFVNQPKVHPEPGVFDWSATDARVAEVRKAGMAVMLCLHQRDATWFVGDATTPWWRLPAGRKEWREFARVCAQRYRGKVSYYEILNEPNHLKKDKPHYMGWDLSVALFLDAARQIEAVEPDALIGGAATWAAWESATWAKRVLAQPEGERLLDFVSYHIYTSHGVGDTDAQILAKTPWFEEAPVHIRRELAKLTEKRILVALTEYNVSAVFTKDGKPFTDPRNVSTFGGMVTALAMLHSARGGCHTAMHFSTMGGFGLIRWPPEYHMRRPYHAVRMLYEVAGMRPGAQVLKTDTSETAKEVKSCVGSKWTACDVESFAFRHGDQRSVVLVNKRASGTVRATVAIPGAKAAELYQYSSTRLPDAIRPLAMIQAENSKLEVSCPAYSVTVLRAKR
jgi:hypothetical protein